MNQKWIPNREVEFIVLCRKWKAALDSGEATTLYHWVASLVDGVYGKINAYLDAFEAYERNDSSGNRTAKVQTRKEAESAMRAFANSSVRYNPFITETIRQEMGLHMPDTVPTTQPRPIMAPNVTAVGTVTHFQHHVRALNPENGKAGKPASVHGVRFTWQVGGERPAEGGAMNNGKFSRKPEIFVSHGEPTRGKMAYYAACYENSKGEAGPWSPVVEAYIG